MATPHASASGAEGANVLLHPLVLLSMCDHFQRATSRSSGSSAASSSSSAAAANTPPTCVSPGRAVGVLFGVQRGLSAEVFTSCELLMTQATESRDIDENYLSEQRSIISAVYPTYELLGWYAVGDASVSDADVQMHQLVSKYNEVPLFLHLRPTLAPGARELPVAAYTLDFHGTSQGSSELAAASSSSSSSAAPAAALAGAATRGVFSSIPLRVEATESERLTVDYCTSQLHAPAHFPSEGAGGAGPSAHAASASSSSSTAAASSASSAAAVQSAAAIAAAALLASGNPVAQHLASVQGALQGLQERIGVMSRYVSAVAAGELPGDRPLLREIASVLSSVPVNDGAALQRALATDATDTMLVATLSGIVGSIDALHILAERNAYATGGARQGGGDDGADLIMGRYGGGSGGPGSSGMSMLEELGGGGSMYGDLGGSGLGGSRPMSKRRVGGDSGRF